jgi:hypothetical protein
VAEWVGEGQTVEGVSAMRAVGTVQSNATPSTAITMLEVATLRVGPMAAQSAASIAQQARRPSEKEESALRIVSEVQPVVTPPPLTEAPMVERVEGYVSMASLVGCCFHLYRKGGFG